MGIQFREIDFICSIKGCKNFENQIKIYVWSDRKKEPNCIFCKKPLKEVIFEKVQIPTYLKFASSSIGEKKAILKQRSHVNNMKKQNQEKRDWMYKTNAGIGGGGAI